MFIGIIELVFIRIKGKLTNGRLGSNAYFSNTSEAVVLLIQEKMV